MIQLYYTASLPISTSVRTRRRIGSHEFSWLIGLCVRQLKGSKEYSTKWTGVITYSFLGPKTLPGRFGILYLNSNLCFGLLLLQFLCCIGTVAADAVLHYSLLFQIYNARGPCTTQLTMTLLPPLPRILLNLYHWESNVYHGLFCPWIGGSRRHPVFVLTRETDCLRNIVNIFFDL